MRVINEVKVSVAGTKLATVCSGHAVDPRPHSNHLVARLSPSLLIVNHNKF